MRVRSLSQTDYYPFGMGVESRTVVHGEYRFGFQAQEQDEETGWVVYKYRMHDPRIARFFAVDPLASKYPYNSAYAFSENRLIDTIELEGLEKIHYSNGLPKNSPIFKIMRSSKILNQLLTDISNPQVTNVNVYFITVSDKYISKTNRGSTWDIQTHNDFIIGTDKYVTSIKKNGLTDTRTEKERIHYLKLQEVFKAIGKSAYQTAAEEKKGIKNYVIALNANTLKDVSTSDDVLAEAVMTVAHEIEAHLKADIKGTSQEGSVEHMFFFALDSLSRATHKLSQRIYDAYINEYPKYFIRGKSIAFKHYPPYSQAGKLFKEVKDTIKKINNTNSSNNEE